MLDGLSNYACRVLLRQRPILMFCTMGLMPLKLLKKAKELDSTNADADFSWAFMIWKIGIEKNYGWFCSGIWKQKGGISKIAAKMLPDQNHAKLSLSDIYIQEKKPGLSEAIISMENQYKNSRLCWAKLNISNGEKLRFNRSGL